MILLRSKRSFLVIGFLCGFLLVLGISLLFTPKTIIGDPVVLSEIDRLLLPVANQNISENDFEKLEELVKNDELAHHEVEELIVLARYKEYSHIGHGLTFLYKYVKSGEEAVCPGHQLAHYYVFNKHGETHLAEHVFEEAEESIEGLNATDYHLFVSHLDAIKNGNSETTEEEISELADAACL